MEHLFIIKNNLFLFQVASSGLMLACFVVSLVKYGKLYKCTHNNHNQFDNPLPQTISTNNFIHQHMPCIVAIVDFTSSMPTEVHAITCCLFTQPMEITL